MVQTLPSMSLHCVWSKQTFVWTSCRFHLVLVAFLEIRGWPCEANKMHDDLWQNSQQTHLHFYLNGLKKKKRFGAKIQRRVSQCVLWLMAVFNSSMARFRMELSNCFEFLFLFPYRNINLLVIHKAESKRNAKHFTSWLKLSNYLELRLILGIRDYCSLW